MSTLLNVFLVLVLVISVWPSLVYVLGQATSPASSSNLLSTVRRGAIGSKRPPHPADPPVCMAKLIMLRHRMQQASARRSQLRTTPASKANNVHGYSRHRPAPSWAGQATYQPTASVGRRGGNTGR